MMNDVTASVTVLQIVDWCPCKEYTRQRIEELFAGRPALTAVDVSELAIPIEDRLWALLHEDFLAKRALRGLAADYAQRYLEREQAAGREPHPRSWSVIAIARRHADDLASDANLSASRWASMAARLASAAWPAWKAAEEIRRQMKQALNVIADGGHNDEQG